MRVTCQPRLILGVIAVTLGAIAPVRLLAQSRTTTVLPDETPRALVVAFRSPEKGCLAILRGPRSSGRPRFHNERALISAYWVVRSYRHPNFALRRYIPD